MPQNDSGDAKVLKAYHETAHAVAGHAMGANVIRVTCVGRTHARVGWMLPVGWDPVPPRERAIPRIVFALAGPIAETIARGGEHAQRAVPSIKAREEVRLCWSMGGPDPARGDDTAKVTRLVQSVYPSDVGAAMHYVTKLSLAAEQYVRTQWSVIEGVVPVLIQRDELSGDAFRQLIHPWEAEGTLGAWPHALSDPEFARLIREAIEGA